MEQTHRARTKKPNTGRIRDLLIQIRLYWTGQCFELNMSCDEHTDIIDHCSSGDKRGTSPNCICVVINHEYMYSIELLC